MLGSNLTRQSIAEELGAAVEEWKRLERRPIANYVVRALSGLPGAYVAQREGLAIGLLFDLPSGAQAPQPVKYSSLSVAHQKLLEIREEDGSSRRGSFALIGIDDARSNIIESFILVMSSVLSVLGPGSEPEHIWRRLEDVGELFDTTMRPPRSDLVGLAGELLLLSTAQNVEFAASGWHVDIRNRFDFAFPSAYVEVKTTESLTRTHFFAASQLQEADRSTHIASIQLVASSAGTTLLGLMDSICAQLSLNSAQRVQETVFATVGADLEAMNDFQFALAGSEAIKFYDVAVVPKVSYHDASRISSVRYQCNLDGLPESTVDLFSPREAGTDQI